jgi:iron complex outermembrane receptor protein
MCKIKVKEGTTLVFSYVGFSKLEKAALQMLLSMLFYPEEARTKPRRSSCLVDQERLQEVTPSLPIDVISSKIWLQLVKHHLTKHYSTKLVFQHGSNSCK